MHSVTFPTDVDPSVVRDIKRLLIQAQPGEVVWIDTCPQSINVELKERPCGFRDEEVLARVLRHDAAGAEAERYVVIPIPFSTQIKEDVACTAHGEYLKGSVTLKAFDLDLAFAVTG